jgi:sulfide:quinone oxidoreductase
MHGPWWSATVRVMHRVLIAGSGVAAVEAVLALRHLAGRNFEIDLLAPEHALEHRPASVATPFGLSAPPPLDLQRLARRYDVELVQDELLAVDPAARAARLTSGARWPYDHLLIAVGARPEPALPGALTFRGPGDVPAVERALAEVIRGDRRHVVVVVPPGSTWPLPAYELAVMAATETRSVVGATVTLVTPEREPLWIFGDKASAELRELLADRGVVLRTAARAAHVTDDVLWLESGEELIGDTVISLPRLVGPGIPGLPSDAGGFLPTDAHGYVRGVERVLAAGDATTFPVKQGGLATQQADAAAAAIAQELGATVEARPFAPVLRGLLLTGGAPLYLRAELDAEGGRRSGAARRRHLAGEVSSRALWWPPGKVAGRYLAPYLSTARPASLGDEPLVDRASGARGGDPDDRDAALDLALLLADEDAEAGDLPQALHALDAAAALAGGVLPAAYAERRRRWLSETRSAP